MAKAPKLVWSSQALLMADVTRRKRSLGLFVAPSHDGWRVLSLETGSQGTAEQILDQHAHKLIGRYDSVARAVERAESFARSWLAGAKSAQHPACDCDEIAAPKTKRRARAGRAQRARPLS